MTHPKSPAKVAVTGAAGNIAYSLLFKIICGNLLGDRPISLQLIDRDPTHKKLEAVLMELEDCASPVLVDCIATSDLEKGFGDADIAILVGAKPRTADMQRKDLLQENGEIFKQQGIAMSDAASADVKVLVVGNPANTNALIALSNAPKLGSEQFSCLTRLDHNRGIAQLAKKVGARAQDITRMTIWGNHSVTQFPDLSYCQANAQAVEVDETWTKEEFIPTVQKRGSEVIQARGASSAASAACASVDHIHDWMHGTPENDWVSMGVLSDGSYGVPEGLVFSYPVTIDRNGKASIVQGLELNDFQKMMLKASAEELTKEREAVAHLIGTSL